MREDEELGRDMDSSFGNGGGEVRFAVIDTETTGFSRYDRIVEFACVTVLDGEIVEEFETLIQPNRDPGPVHIHGITPSILETAPEFESLAGDIATRLHGAMLVAHNISFDLRMLRQEIERVPTMTLDPGQGICSYLMTKKKLSLAAQEAGISQPDHTALGDARVVARMLINRLDHWANPDLRRATCDTTDRPANFTVRRPGAPARRGALSMLALRTAWPRTTRESEVLYLDTLDRCLDDGVLTSKEQAWLTSTAYALRLDDTHREDLHRRYYELLVRRILADGIITREERDLHDKVAAALMIDRPEPVLDDAYEPPEDSLELLPGMKVCFTGVVIIDGNRIHRKELEHLARQKGLQPVKSVTRKCRLLVAGDPLSRSGKAGKARAAGIPVMDGALFHTLIVGGTS